MKSVLKKIVRSAFVKNLLEVAMRSALLTEGSRRSINDLYNKLSYDNKYIFHALFAKIFRDKIATINDSIWEVNHNNISIRIPLRGSQLWLDWDIASSILGHDVDVKQTYDLILSSKFRPKYFFDIGANYGTHTLLLSLQNINTISFEPNPTCLDYFKGLLKFNNIDNKIENIALGDKESIEKLWFQETETWNGSILGNNEKPNSKGIDIKVKTLDNYVKETGIKPNLLKIDTEGFELNVLKGGSTCISEENPFIILESNLGSDRSSLIEQLDKLDYKIYQIPLIIKAIALNKVSFVESKKTNFLCLPKDLDIGEIFVFEQAI